MPVPHKSFVKEQYLRRLHKEGYPATYKERRVFNWHFYGDLELQKDARPAAQANVRFVQKAITSRVCPRCFSKTDELKKIFRDVVKDYLKKRPKSQPENDETSAIDENPNGSDVDMETEEDDSELVKSSDGNLTGVLVYAVDGESELGKLKEQLAEKDGEIMQPKNRNEELTKIEECQQLEEENHSLKEDLQKKAEEQVQL